jgi:tRNA U34 5-methylaminomethyl-2-thiouridine-forming methyltransferase MnmC
MQKNYKETNDGSYTLFSQEYNQSYHSQKDGALSESIYKHIKPAFSILEELEEITILDICFGLGYNTLATLYYLQKNNMNKKIKIFSPELDRGLIDLLKSFKYPKELKEYKVIIEELIKNNKYESDSISIELFIGDAREYIKQIDTKIDIVYQDAFSSDVNKELWTKEYFRDIKKLLNNRAVITTYSIATPVRLSLYENGLEIYEYKSELKRRSTLAVTFDIKNLLDVKYIDMEQKKKNNPDARPLIDDFS